MPRNASLTEKQVHFFHEEGYLIVNDVFDPAELEPLRREIEQKVDRKIAEMAGAGKLTETHAGESFERRLARIYEDSEANGLEIVRELEGSAGGGHCGIEMFRMITHPKLLAAVESLVGPEIIGSSVYRIRPKIPGFAKGELPWHQDSGYFSPTCDQHMILTVWMPLVDVNQRNGCMQILPRAHRQGVLRHYTGGRGGFLVIKDEDLPPTAPRPVVAEVPRGGAVFMTNLTPHCSTPNHTDEVRWSIDLRYQSTDAPNNVGLWPSDDGPPDEQFTMACYPPEADFIVQSRRRPEQVASYEDFVNRRMRYEQAKQKHGPKRGWTPVTEAPSVWEE